MMTRGIACFLPALAVVLMLFAQPAAAQDAGAKAREIDSLFTGLCLAYLGDGNKIVEQAAAIGAKPLPKIIATQFLAPRKGVAWAVQGASGLYMLGLNDQQSCRVIGPDAGAVETLHAFASGPKRRKVGEELVNDRVQHVYAVVVTDAQSQQEKQVVVIATVSPDVATPGIFLDALPYGIAKQAGIVIEDWPQ